jgi:hypothetical protein
VYPISAKLSESLPAGFISALTHSNRVALTTTDQFFTIRNLAGIVQKFPDRHQ